jgi:ABC-type Fe3+/spermidine/putrescine transport system ATPase subunit
LDKLLAKEQSGGREAKMKQYKVTLNFTFATIHDDVNDVECDDYTILMKNEEGETIETEEEAYERKKVAFLRTQLYYEKHDVIDYIKESTAKSFIDELYPVDMEIVSAEWTPGEYQLQMVVRSELSAEEIEESLRNEPLEDGIYEGTGDSGWQIWTRGPNDEVVGTDDWDMTDFWVYGESDYRNNEILVEEV